MESNPRLESLEQRFSDLESQLRDSPEKHAISILHGLIHESRRMQAAQSLAEAGQGPRADVANLYKSAPAMEGKAAGEGLRPGTPAPDFSLRDANGKSVALRDFRGQKVVLVFYPLDWSPACSDQLSLYQDELDEFARHGAQLVGISVDSLYSHGAWAAVRGLTIPLLSDFQPKGDTARRYRVYRDADGFSDRALFIVDAAGIIRYCHVSPELHKVPDIYDLFERLKALDGGEVSGVGEIGR